MSGIDKSLNNQMKFKNRELFEQMKKEAVKNRLVDKDGKLIQKDDKQISEGNTKIREVDVKKVIGSALKDSPVQANGVGAQAMNEVIANALDLKYGDGVVWDSDSTNFLEFLQYMTKDKDIETSEFINILKDFMKAVGNREFGLTSVSTVTGLINCMLTFVAQLEQQGIFTEEERKNIENELRAIIEDIAMPAVLNGTNGNASECTCGDVKNFVNELIAKYVNDDSDRPGVTPGDDPDPVIDTNQETIVIDTPEKAMGALEAKIAEYEANAQFSNILSTKIEEFLLGFKEETSLYIQLQYGYDKDFADIIVMFLAQSIKHQYMPKNGNSALRTRADVEARFFELIKDLSFLNTSDTLMACTEDKYGIHETRITKITSYYNEDGFRLWSNEGINRDNNLSYNTDRTINQGMFLMFITNYFRDTVFGGELNESQLKLLYEKVLKEFAGDKYKNGEVALNANSAQYDKDGDGNYFNDLLRAMMKVAEEYIPINVGEITNDDINLDGLFGAKSSVSVSNINNARDTYLLNNDPAIRLILGELIGMSDKNNITTDADYLDFMNIFVQMLNKECGIADTLDENGNQILTREALEKYLERHSIQELRDFIRSDKLRNAFYESTFKINGELEGFQQNISGNCWMLSGLMSLYSSPEGKEIIKNAISYNPETGEYSVTFYGGWDPDASYYSQKWQQTETTYTFTKEQLFELMATGKYSKIQKSEDGTLDWDLFLLEVAIAEHRAQYGRAPYEGFVTDDNIDANLYMGSQDELISYLTGIDVGLIIGGDRSKDSTYYGTSMNYRKNLHQLVNNLIAQGLIDADGTIHNYAFYFSTGGHAYAITKVTADRIYFVDPYDSSKEYYMTWADFESGTAKYYDSQTGKLVKDSNGKAKTLTIAESGYVGPLDESPAMNHD